MIKKIPLCFLMLLYFSIKAQINTEALINFNKASYVESNSNKKNDAIIVFDRTYLDIQKTKAGLELYKTVHRKVKINSLYGLEHYNKLFIPTINKYDVKLEFVDCKVKTLKRDNKVIITNSKSIVTTTLPANAPFFYKVEGKVKMLAVKGVNIGDEIEYIFTTKQTYESTEYFYKAGKVNYSTSDYCIEKSLFINAPRYNVSLWPYNFHDGTNRNTDFLDDKRYKVTLKNINPRVKEIYSNPNVDEPYLFYEIELRESEEFDNTWEDFAKYFKPKRRNVNKGYIFNGQSFEDNFWDLKDIKNRQKVYSEILKRINKPIEKNFRFYDEVRDNIEISFNYAKIISKTTKKLKLPINFHFVRNKSYGVIDKSFVSLYQFDNIICSFKNEKNVLVFFPLLEPYSTLNNIRKEYQLTESFNIFQNAEGKRTHGFGIIPELNSGFFEKNVHLILKEVSLDSLNFTVQESLKFSGHSWVNIKPTISHIIKDSLKAEKRLKSFINQQIVQHSIIDSVYNIDYMVTKEAFKIDYQYELPKKIESNSSYFNFRPYQFFEKDFFTPYYLKNERVHKGYFTNEFNTRYKFSFEGSKAQWLENNLLNSSKINEFGKTISAFNYDDKMLETSVKLELKKNEFNPSDWGDVLSLRQSIYDFLSTKLFFKLL